MPGLRDVMVALIEGLVEPRRSMRRLLARDPDVAALVGFVLFGYAVQAAALAGLSDLRAESGATLLGWHTGQLIGHCIGFLLTAGAMFGVGRLFGGIASLDDCMTATAWHGVVTGVLSPLLVVGMLGVQEDADGNSGVSALLLMVTVGITAWVLAGNATEVHGFRSVWPVFATTIAASLMVGVLVSGG